MATIADIARETGLARTTVAEVLRGKPGYSDASRQRVHLAAKRLGYQPNYLSKALSGGKSMTIGIVVPNHMESITNERLSAAEALARQHGYLAYVTGWGDDDASDAAARAIENLLQRRVDGLLLYYESRFPARVAEVLQASEVPRVLFNAAPPDVAAAVRIQPEAALADLAEHLRALGHRRVALLATRFHLAHREFRTNPTLAAFEAAGVEIEPLEAWRLPPGDLTSIDAYQFIQARLQSGAALPSAILAQDDEGAQGILAALHHAGLRVPTDVSLVGYHGRPIAATTIPPLTTIHEPGREVGEAAVRMLLQRMQHPDDPVEPVAFPCKLIVRDSTGPAPVPA